jgi:heme/copper-type cytochrome/quinol oxidase subunit 4
MMFYVEKRSKPAKEGWAATNTSESILISILHFIGVDALAYMSEEEEKRKKTVCIYTPIVILRCLVVVMIWLRLDSNLA